MKFFDGTAWVTTEKENEDVELTWSDWADPSELEALQRGHSVALGLRKGQHFAVQMKARAQDTHERTGWCVYRALGNARVLDHAAVIRNHAARGDKEIPAGSLVVEGRPLLCTGVEGGTQPVRPRPPTH